MISVLPSAVVLPSILVILLSRVCSSTIVLAASFVPSSSSSSSFARERAISNLDGCHRRRLRTASSVVRAGYDYDDDDDDGGENYVATTTITTTTIDRREALSRSTSILAGAVASSSTILGLRPSPALASPPSAVGVVDAVARATRTSSSSSAIVPSGGGAARVLCDPSVSTWVRTYDDGGGIGIGIGGGGSASRTVHILGTAHISSSSAELAGRMVRDLRPDVVFVELDAKRVARAMPGGVGGGGGAAAAPGGAGAAGNSNDPAAPPPAATTTTTTKTSVIAASPPPRDGASSSATTTNPFDVQSRLVDAGSKVVGESVRGMYTKLESEGFKAGDEFATSVREGLAIGSTIVLGDRDVEVTLRRLTRALTKTDIRKLLSPDSEVEKSMEGLLPEGMKKSLTRQSSSSSSGGGGGGGGNDMGDGGGSASKMTGMGMEVSIDKSDFNDFVETMKARENVRKIMSALRSTAPEIYEAMVAERDEYMGRGLDELGANLPGRSSGRTVAVVGMAHVDGIERYLASRGWTEMSYPCPR